MYSEKMYISMVTGHSFSAACVALHTASVAWHV